MSVLEKFPVERPLEEGKIGKLEWDVWLERRKERNPKASRKRSSGVRIQQEGYEEMKVE